MKTIYACTFYDKTATADVYEEGCSTKSWCVMSSSINLQSSTLLDLIKNISTYLGIDIDDVFLQGDEADDVTTIGYNRLEDEDGNQPSERQLFEWKRGRLKLYLCDYSFAIEKRIIEPILESEFGAAGIKTH